MARSSRRGPLCLQLTGQTANNNRRNQLRFIQITIILSWLSPYLTRSGGTTYWRMFFRRSDGFSCGGSTCGDSSEPSRRQCTGFFILKLDDTIQEFAYGKMRVKDAAMRCCDGRSELGCQHDMTCPHLDDLLQ